MQRILTSILTVITLISLVVTTPARAGNIDLSTVPDRDSVQLTIYNSEDITLVRETRKVTFKKGINPLQFSWANTLIDPTSVELRFLASADKLEILDTTFPQDRPQVLYWNVQSDVDGEAAVEISYFTSGITWSADYVCITDKDETKAAIDSFVRVTNNSGEDYENAQVRLVVGTINLVEKIAQLSQMPRKELESLDRGALRDEFRKSGAAKISLGAMGGRAEASAPTTLPEEKQIIKEGLSEYFIYTVEGRETVPHGWSKRLRSLQASEVPLKIQYRYRLPEYGDQLVRMYLLTNDKDSHLGTTPLPDGIVRVFRDNGRDGLSYLVSQPIKYIPIGDKIELNLGQDPEVIFELIKQRSWRDNIWMQLTGVDVFRRVGDGKGEIDVNSAVVGWDDHGQFVQRIRNYTSRPIDVEIRRSYDGHVVFRSGLQPKLFDYRTVQFQSTIPARKKADLPFELQSHQGRNARQNNVTLEDVAKE